MLLLLHLLNGFQGLYKVKQLFKNTTKRPAPRLVSYKCQGVWEVMGRYLGQWEPPVFWNFIPGEVQNPDKLVKYLLKACCHTGHFRDTNHCRVVGPSPSLPSPVRHCSRRRGGRPQGLDRNYQRTGHTASCFLVIYYTVGLIQHTSPPLLAIF